MPVGTDLSSAKAAWEAGAFAPVELPHDWLIDDCHDFYRDGTGWYRKEFVWDMAGKAGMGSAPERAFLIFDGVYMNSAYYLNGQQVYEWKNGYTRCTFEITDFLRKGANELMVSVTFEAPNSRWYSGAGIERNVWLMTTGQVCIPDGGIYISTARAADGGWDLHVQTEIDNPQETPVRIAACLYDDASDSAADAALHPGNPAQEPAAPSVRMPAADLCPEEVLSASVPADGTSGGLLAQAACRCTTLCQQTMHLGPEAGVEPWDIRNPKRYRLEVCLTGPAAGEDAPGRNEEPEDVIWPGREDVLQTEDLRIGFRTIRFDPDTGLYLNGRHVKLQGVCLHTDHGALGNAFHVGALRRQLRIMKEMGVNAVRFAHNPFAAEALDLTDEMGLLAVDECYDMWEMPKNRFDYARFFDEWQARDVESFVRRDRNHPSLFLWSIGNEIYDQHTGGERGVELSRMLMEEVYAFDPMHNAAVTTGSNYMPWENAQRCADVYKIVGYNYAEKYYAAHHKAHPDWVIYGSETCSICSSRGIYHFPLDTEILSDEDEQCSALGNSITSWGARSIEECVCTDRDLPYSMGQFLWAGMDYLGEPTPYHTKNSYLGMADTAGFPKDLYYVWQSAWTDVREHPMVHVFPYWDFSVGQEVDVRVCSNASEVELFRNGVSLGRQTLDHAPGSGRHVVADWKVRYEPGFIKAVAYEDGAEVASQIRRSFGDTAGFAVRKDPECSGRLRFYEISAVDAQGNPVENAMDFVRVEVSGGRLAGLDNGDSTDRYPFKGNERHLFSGKLLAIVEVEKDPASEEPCGGDRTAAGPEDDGAAAHLDGDDGVPPCQAPAAGALSPVQNEPAQDAGRALLLSQAAAHPEIVPGTTYEGAPFCEYMDEEGIRLHVTALAPVAVRGITLEAQDGYVFTPERPVLRAAACVKPANASDAHVVFSAVNDRGVPVNIVDLKQDGTSVTMRAKGDGTFRLRCISESGSGHVRVVSQVEYRIEGFGPAYLDPYGFISASLYTASQGEVGSGNEKGIATARDGDTTVTWSGMDFGPVGSDTVTIPIFALTGEEYPIEIWEGTPGGDGAQLLLDAVYCKPSMWNVYQPETFVLPKRLTGMASFSIRVHRKMHIKGFSFARCDRAWTRLYAQDADEIYGDSFRRDGRAVRGIGNNVSLLYHDMEFAQHPLHGIRVCGMTPLAVNTIHLRFQNEEGEEREILEFRGGISVTNGDAPKNMRANEDSRTEGNADGARGTVQEFALHERSGIWEMTFVFLPGSNFDLEWFELY